jgi:hypothetical protein
MWNPEYGQPTVFAIEYQQFTNAGYRQVGEYLLPPKR